MQASSSALSDVDGRNTQRFNEQPPSSSLRDPRSFSRPPAQMNHHQQQNGTPLISPNTHALRNAEKTLDDINENFYGNTTPTTVTLPSPSSVGVMKDGFDNNDNNNRMTVMNNLHDEMRRRPSNDARRTFASSSSFLFV